MFLKTKSEVSKRFQEFKPLVEIQTGRKIKVLRSDNGGEYTLGEFVDYCAKAGIRREFTVPYNPQQNEVAERKNRSIFVGYSETSKAFRIYIPVRRKVVVKQDVKFKEDRAFRRSRELEYLDSPNP